MEEIGTADNLYLTYTNLLLLVNLERDKFKRDEEVDKKRIKEYLQDYHAARHCCEGDTRGLNDLMNKMVEKYPEFAKHIGYKLIN